MTLEADELSAGSCCMPCQTHSIAFATMASSPTVDARISPPAAVSCSIPATVLHPAAPNRPPNCAGSQPTSLSVRIAAVPCGASQPCRAPTQPFHCDTSLSPPMSCVAIKLNAAGGAVQNGATQVTMPIELANCCAVRCRIAGARLRAQRSPQSPPSPAEKPHAVRCRQASQHLHCADAAATIPIVPNHPRLRSSGFDEVALTPPCLPRSHYATSQYPLDSQ